MPEKNKASVSGPKFPLYVVFNLLVCFHFAAATEKRHLGLLACIVIGELEDEATRDRTVFEMGHACRE